jgi:WD40 repeat protein
VTETAITEKKVLPHAGAITSVSWSPNGKYLVATDIARKVSQNRFDIAVV